MGIVSTPPALPSTTVKRPSRAVMRSGVFTISAIRNPQIDEEKKPRMDGKGYATATGRRSIARKPVRGRHLISCSETASASFGQRLNSAFNAHDPSMRAS